MNQINISYKKTIKHEVSCESVNAPWVRGSRPTLRWRSCSRCLSRGSETPPWRHTVRPRRPSARAAPLRSEGGRARRRSSSRTSRSACCRCSPEDSSARGRHSKPPGEETHEDFSISGDTGEEHRKSFCTRKRL